MKLLTIVILALLLASCATSYETKGGQKFRLEFTGNVLDYYRAANGQEMLTEPKGFTK